MRQETVYELHDLDGNFVDSGTAKELGERLYVHPATIWDDAKDHHILLHEYTVNKKEAGQCSDRK